MVDQETVLWLVSTAPQVLAALTALSMAAMTFKVGSIDSLIGRDDTQTDILEGLKIALFRTFKWIVIPSICVIAVDLFYIYFSEWITKDEIRLLCLIILFMFLNLGCLVLLCIFPIMAIAPDFKKRVIKDLMKKDQEEYHTKNGETCEKKDEKHEQDAQTVDPGAFIIRFRDLEGNLRRIVNTQKEKRPMTTLEMIRAIYTDRLITKDQFFDLLRLNRTRNFVAHEPDIEFVDKFTYDKLNDYVASIEELANSLSQKD